MKGTIEERTNVIGALLTGVLSYAEAAQRLCCCRRTIERCVARYRARGTSGMKHGLIGRRSNRAKPATLRTEIVSWYRESCSNPSLATFARHIECTRGVRISRETIRLWLIAAGLRTTSPTRCSTLREPDPQDFQTSREHL